MNNPIAAIKTGVLDWYIKMNGFFFVVMIKTINKKMAAGRYGGGTAAGGRGHFFIYHLSLQRI